MKKLDVLPLGISFQARPQIISRMPPVEIVFTPDGFPAREFDIFPKSDASYTMDVIAYQYSPALDNIIYTHNWLTDNVPDVLLFGALVEAAAYFPEDERIPEWKNRWNEAVWTLYSTQSKEKYSGRMLAFRYPDTINRRSGLGMSTDEKGVLTYGYAIDNEV
jgi:hypothetical protein